MRNNNADIELLAGLNLNSSETEILRAIKVLEQRIRRNKNAKISLDTKIDEKNIRSTIEKLQSILKSKDLKIETKTSIEAIAKEADAMLDVMTAARKAAQEKLEFAEANKKVKVSANDTVDAINRERNAMNSLDDIDAILDNINMSGRQGNSVFRQFGTTLREAFSTYTVANLLQDALYKVVDAGKEALDTVKQFDDINVDLQMATGADKDYVKGLISDYAELGGELGALTETVAESADTFLRQGRSMEETNQLIEDAIVLSKVAKTEGEKASEILTATINGFQLVASEGSRVNDVLSSIDLNSASSAEGIGEALTKVASMANNAGVSLEKTAAMIATIKDVTQDADTTIGTSLKTVLSRMNQIRAGKFIDEESGEALNDVEKVLGAIGISMRDVNGQFKEAEEVIDEVGTKWKTLDSNTQKAVTTAMGGVYQANKLVSLFDNYDKVIELTKVAEESAGTALQKFNDSYLPSLEAKTNALKSSLQSLATTTISDEFYGSVLDSTKAIVDMTTETGMLKGALAGLVTAGAFYTFQHLTSYLQNATQEFANLGEAMQITQNANGTITDIQRLIDLTGGLSESQTRLLLSTNNLTDAQKVAILMNQGLTQEQAEQVIVTWGVATAQQGATGATLTWNNALRGLWATLMANPLILVSTAVTVGVMAFNKYKQAQEDAAHATEKVLETLEESVSDFRESTEGVEELNNELKTCAEKIAELQKLADAGTISITDAEQLKLLKETNEELERKLALEQAEAIKKGKDVLKTAKGVSDTKIKSQYISEWDEGAAMSVYLQVTPAEELEASIRAYNHVLNQLNSFDESKYASKDVAKNIKKGLEKDVANAETQIYEMQQIISDTISAYNALQESGFVLDEEAQAEYNGLRKVQDAYLLFNYELLKTKEAFQGLNTEQQKNILLNRLLEQGLADVQAKSIISNISDAKLDDAWDKDFSFTPPQLTDYTTAEEYGKAYAEAWLKGVEDSVKDDSEIDSIKLSKNQIKHLETYQKHIQTISKSIADLNNLDSSDIISLMTDFVQYDEKFEEVFKKFGVTGVKGVGDLRGALVEIARQMKETATTDVPQMSSAIEDMYKIISNPKGSIDKFSFEIQELEEILQKSQNGENVDNIETLINKYGDLADSVVATADGYSIEEDALISLINARITNLNTAISYESELTKRTLDSIRSRIEAYGLEEKHIAAIADIWKKTGSENAILDYTNRVLGSGVSVDPELLSKYADYSLELEESLKGIRELYDKTDSKKDPKNNTIDWMTTSLENLQEAVDDTNRAFDNAKGIEAQKEALASLNGELEKLRKGYRFASDEYNTRYKNALYGLNEFGYDKDDIQRKIKAGHIFDTDNFPSEVAELINEAIDAWNGKRDADNKYAEIGVEIDENNFDSVFNLPFDDIKNNFDNQLSHFENSANLIEAQLANAEARGRIATQSYYKSLQTVEQQTYEVLKANLEKLNELMTDSALEENSDEWHKLQNEIEEVNIAMQESQNTLFELDKQIRQIDWDVFDFARGQEDNLMSEADFLIDLLSGKDMYDELGNITSDGLTTMGLHASNYNAYLEQSIKYAEELKDLNGQILANPDDTGLIERYDELVEKQRESILASQQETEAIQNLVADGIELQKSALRDLIDSYTEELELQRDIYEFNKRNSEQTKKIANIQKQLSAYSGDNSEEARVAVQRLNVELSEAKDSLESDQYDRYISDQKEILDSIYNQYEQSLDAYLSETNTVLSDAINRVNDSNNIINDTIKTETEKVGFEISDEMRNIWSGENSVLSTGFNGVKDNVDKNTGVLSSFETKLGQTLNGLRSELTNKVGEVSTDTEEIKSNTDELTTIDENTSHTNALLGGISSNISETNKKLDTIASKIDGIEVKSEGSSVVSSGSSNSSSSGNSTVDFIYSKDYFDKDKLNTEYSILDRLKAHDFASDVSARAKYYEQMFGKPYKNTAEQNEEMLKWMKLNGYSKGVHNLKRDELAWTHPEELIVSPDGGILSVLKQGTTVIKPELSQRLLDMANNPSQFIMDNLKLNIPDFTKPNANQGNTTQIGDINLTIPLNNVTDVNSFIKVLQSPRGQNIIKDTIAEATIGGSSMAKYRH